MVQLREAKILDIISTRYFPSTLDFVNFEVHIKQKIPTFGREVAFISGKPEQDFYWAALMIQMKGVWEGGVFEKILLAYIYMYRVTHDKNHEELTLMSIRVNQRVNCLLFPLIGPIIGL